MSKKKYTPDIKGVTQWLKDNPTKKNSRGRTVSTGKTDAYKAVGYKGPPLKSKEGNLTNNRDSLRLSLRGDNGDTARAAASKPYSVEEFIDYGKRNGYGTEHSTQIFNQFQEKNKAQKASILPGQANDHFSPNSAEYYSAGENYRNRVGLGVKVNGFKTNKMPTPAEMRSAGVPTTRSSLIQMEFNNTPAPDPKTLRSLASQIARDNTRTRATTMNKKFGEAQHNWNLQKPTGLQNLIDAGQQSLKRGVTKIARNAVPYAGTALDAQDTAQRFDEFKQNPNAINGAQLAVQGLSTAANSVGDLALSTGVLAPIAAGAEKVAGLMTLTDALLQGVEDYSNGRSGR